MMLSTANKTVQPENSQKVTSVEDVFVVKPFVQAPDAEIKIAGRLPKAVRWADRWDRKCGNPATSIIASR